MYVSIGGVIKDFLSFSRPKSWGQTCDHFNELLILLFAVNSTRFQALVEAEPVKILNFEFYSSHYMPKNKIKSLPNSQIF